MSTENNKLIAEFMELPKVPCRIGTERGVITEGYKHPNVGVPMTTNGMQYKYSWDWLMPVVEKIENFGFEFIIAESRCKIKHNTDHSIEELFHIETIGSKINTTYDAVVKFINEYNFINNQNQ